MVEGISDGVQRLPGDLRRPGFRAKSVPDFPRSGTNRTTWKRGRGAPDEQVPRSSVSVEVWAAIGAIAGVAGLAVALWKNLSNPRLDVRKLRYRLFRWRVRTGVLWVRPTPGFPEEQFRYAINPNNQIKGVIGFPKLINIPKGTAYPWPMPEEDYERLKQRWMIQVVGRGEVKLFRHINTRLPVEIAEWADHRNRLANDKTIRRLIKKRQRRFRREGDKPRRAAA